MHKFVSFNSRTVESSEPALPALASAALYGKGIFTTIAIYNSTPFLWEKHWRRLAGNAAYLGIDLSEFSESVTSAALKELLDENRVSGGRARITFFDEQRSDLWPYHATRRTSLLITTSDRHPEKPDFNLTVSPHRTNSTSPLTGIKSCNYLEEIFAKDEAKHRGFDEAIRLNERGEIVSACVANVFWLKDGRFFTPSLGTGCLPGTTREFVLEKLECEEVEAEIKELASADEIFLTSAGIAVVQVAEFEGRRLGGQPHAISQLLPASI
jgi:branched-subunit amino acid aminotransferase/4-amino-4-deoxychorismate lyase